MDKKVYIFIGVAYPKDSKTETSWIESSATNIKNLDDIKNFHSAYGDKLTVVLRSRKSNWSKFWFPKELIGFTEQGQNGLSALGVPHFGETTIHEPSLLKKLIYVISFLPNLLISKRYILREVRKLIKSGITPENIILLPYSPTLGFTHPCYLAKKKYGCKYIELLDSGPVFSDGGLIRALILKIFRGHDGVITYVADAAKDFAPDLPYEEIFYPISPEILDEFQNSQKSVEKRDFETRKPVIAYTGHLSDTYQLDKILEIIKLTGGKYKWKIAGFGPLTPEFKTLELGSKYDVEFFGSISNAEAARLQTQADLLLCLKGGNSTQYLRYATKYAASGKLTEYIASGTPVITSDIPAFSKQIKPFVNLIDTNATSEEIAAKIAELFENYSDALDIAKRGQQFGFENFTSKAQHKKTIDFINRVTASSD